jgi:hypothetical protein
MLEDAGGVVRIVDRSQKNPRPRARRPPRLIVAGLAGLSVEILRMNKDDKRLREKVAELLGKAEQADAEEDAIHGKDGSGDELPEDLRHAKDRRARIRQLMKELEEETKRQQEAEKAARDKDDPPPPVTGDDLPSHWL